MEIPTLPRCSWCKRQSTSFSYGLCPDCMEMVRKQYLNEMAGQVIGGTENPVTQRVAQILKDLTT